MDLVTLAAAKSYIDKRINEGEVVTGATPQQAAQIEQNKINIAGLQTEIENKQPKGNYVKTVNGNKPDASGNVVVATSGNSEAGFSPIATVKQTDSGAVISITDKNGTTTATIINGIDGKDGADGAPGEKGDKGDPGKDGSNGEDGISATHSWNGTVLSITSASGTSSVDLKGEKGDAGAKGPKGDTGAKGDDGADGGHYTPIVTQPTSDTMRISFTPSKSDMPAVNPVTVNLPVSEGSGENLTLDTTLTQSGKAADAKATGDEIKRVEGKIPSIEGLAKTEDIPTKPEDIGAQPAGNYLTSAPVTSVNGKVGAVVLGAVDVGARPDTWVPTAQEVGALPNTYVPPTPTAEQVGADPTGTAASAVSAHNISGDAHNDLRLAVQKLQAAVDAFLDVDDTTRDSLSEVLALIDANADVIEAITTSKVSAADIVDNLTTNVSNKPLSAAQGVVLKTLIDGLSTGKLDASKLQEAINTALAQAKANGEFDGKDGKDGADGYTPIKGVDYYTDEDKSEFSEYIASELAKRGQLKPEFANSIEECTDTSKLYVLPDGYIYAYMLIEREVETGGEYTNLAVNLHQGYRYNSGGTLVEESNPNACACSDFIPFDDGTVVRVRGFGDLGSFNCVGYGNTGDQAQSSFKPGVASSSTNYMTYAYDAATDTATLTSKGNSYAQRLRIVGVLSGSVSDVIITVNEEITDGGTEIIKEYAWANTGHAFVPADYEERIVELEEDVLQLKNTVGTQGGSTGEAVTLPAYWEPEVEAKATIVKALQEVGGKHCVSFVHAADLHIDDNDNGRTTDIGKVMAAMLDRCHIPWAVLSGDINTRASYGTEAGLLEAQSAMSEHLAPLWGTERLLLGLGNHDGCWGDSSGYYRHQFPPERMWDIFFRWQALDSRRVFSDDGLYFYVDNVAQKTRFIVLNSHFGGEYAEDSNGWAVNNRFATSCYGQAQLDWLADVALDMPEGYGAVITAHVPPNITYTVDRAQLIGIVNAYNAKSTFSGNYTAGVDGWSNSTVDVDFAGAKGEIIAMFTGHVHGDSIDSTTMSCPIITILSAGASPNDPYKDSAPTRTPGTDTETSFDVVTINRKARMIYCTRVGAGDDREVGY